MGTWDEVAGSGVVELSAFGLFGMKDSCRLSVLSSQLANGDDCFQLFFHTLQNEVAPNHVKVRVKTIATTTRPVVVWPAW
jgi:hypothetical protein